VGSGVRDTGDDAPEHGKADRPVGNVDPDANPPMSDPSAKDVYSGTGELPPQDTGSAIPPYEGRTQSGSPRPEGAQSSSGQTTPTQSAPDRNDEGTGPAHVPGTSRGETRA
jgi:hypothetical protein